MPKRSEKAFWAAGCAGAALVLAACAAPAPPSAESAAVQKRAADLAHIAPAPQKIDGSLLVILPTAAETRDYIARTSPPPLTDQDRERRFAALEGDLEMRAQALDQAHLFDRVLIRRADDPQNAAAAFDYRLRASLEDPHGPAAARERWLLDKPDGAARPVTTPFLSGQGASTLNAWVTFVSNTAADLGAPVQKRPVVVVQSGPPAASPQTSGTAFFINAQGYALTAAHVTENCKSLKLALPDGVQAEATVAATDHANDLAVLKVASGLPVFARFSAAGQPRMGEEVVTYGFPLAGALSSHGNLAPGVVSAVTGLRDDTRFLQITAPIQPGNSGGPLLDGNGAVVGVINSKLNAMKMASATGDIPQNVNFAVKAGIVFNFLDTNGIAYERRTAAGHAPAAHPLSVADIGDQAKTFTVMALCRK